jgi:hypothetical protein
MILGAFFMNIHNELLRLYQCAIDADQHDLAFRILACLAKLKPNTLSIDTLSDADIEKIIDECIAVPI